MELDEILLNMAINNVESRFAKGVIKVEDFKIKAKQRYAIYKQIHSEVNK